MAVDFSFPQWMRDQHSFADSLAKGAQVGAIIANNRYRNQALAAQAIQAEREYELRERHLAAQVRTDDLNFRLRSQLIEDQTADKAAISDWVQQRNRLSPEARLEMSMPELRLPQSYNIANQIVDNDRMVFEQSIDGQTKASLTRRLAKLDADDIFRFRTASDPDEQIAILEAGEAKVAAREQELETHRATLQMKRDQLKPQSGSHYDLPYSAQILMKSELDELSRRIRDEGLSTDEAAVIRNQIESKYRTSSQPAVQSPTTKALPSIGEVRQGYEYLGGDPADRNSWRKVQ